MVLTHSQDLFLFFLLFFHCDFPTVFLYVSVWLFIFIFWLSVPDHTRRFILLVRRTSENSRLLSLIVFKLFTLPQISMCWKIAWKRVSWPFKNLYLEKYLLHEARISQHSLYASKLWTIKPLSVQRWYYWTLCYCFNSLYLPSICSNHLLKNSVFKIINLESNVPIIAAKLVTQWKLLFGDRSIFKVYMKQQDVNIINSIFKWSPSPARHW